jgi:hypothetical protein
MVSKHGMGWKMAFLMEEMISEELGVLMVVLSW